MPTTSYRELILPQDAESLVAWLSAEPWPFHVHAELSPERARALLAAGGMTGDDQQSFWICEGEQRVGLVRLMDLDDVDDGSPVFDLRVAAAHRGRGVGREAVRWLTAHLFERFPQLDRIAGSTRVDNRAMRRVFRACGYVKEGHFRESWPDAAGRKHDAVHYAILRRDWSSRTTTPVRWDDETS